MATSNIADGNQEIVLELHQIFISHLIDHNAPDEFLDLWQKAANEPDEGGIWAIDYAQP